MKCIEGMRITGGVSVGDNTDTDVDTNTDAACQMATTGDERRREEMAREERRGDSHTLYTPNGMPNTHRN
jgi:urease accessory protein UreH